MSKLDDLTERAVATIVTHVPGAGVAAIALLSYGLGLGVPLALGWSRAALVAANVCGTTFAAVLGVAWLMAQIEAGHRRRLVEWTTNLRLLTSEEFEWLVGELFRREGWKVREVGRTDGPDGNIDLELSRDGRRQIVQCKRWQSWPVGVDDVRGFAGTLLREQLPASSGVFVTLSAFTAQAGVEAKKIGLTLIDGPELHRRIEKVRRSEPCTVCGEPMRLARSQHGWWLRCVAPGCVGKRDLSPDPGRAIELLTEPAADRRSAS